MAVKVREIMTENPEVISPDDTLQDAARRMKQMDVGMLPVCEGDRITGTLTDRDISIRCVAEGKDPTQARVRDAMTGGEVLCCAAEEDVKVVAKRMRDHQVRRLPVLDTDKTLIGIVSLGDVALHADDRTAGNALEGVSQPSA
jgi:CBS domain-containing protein